MGFLCCLRADRDVVVASISGRLEKQDQRVLHLIDGKLEKGNKLGLGCLLWEHRPTVYKVGVPVAALVPMSLGECGLSCRPRAQAMGGSVLMQPSKPSQRVGEQRQQPSAMRPLPPAFLRAQAPYPHPASHTLHGPRGAGGGAAPASGSACCDLLVARDTGSAV